MIDSKKLTDMGSNPSLFYPKKSLSMRIQAEGKGPVISIAHGLPAADLFPIGNVPCSALCFCVEVSILEKRGLAFSCQSLKQREQYSK